MLVEFGIDLGIQTLPLFSRNGNGDTAETLPYDIGAFERTSADYGDLDGDCTVGMADFAILAAAWQRGDNRADIVPGLAGRALWT